MPRPRPGSSPSGTSSWSRRPRGRSRLPCRTHDGEEVRMAEHEAGARVRAGPVEARPQGPYLRAWCATCERMVLPERDGRCSWCHRQTGANEAPHRPEPATWPLRPGDRGYGTTCACGRRKERRSLRCQACRLQSSSVPRGPFTLDEAALAEARRAYLAGESLRGCAQALARRYPGRTAEALLAAIYRGFRHHDWPRRPRAEAARSPGRVRCGAPTRSGAPCRAYPRHGHRRCVRHLAC